jgi:hypothetical protein
MTWAPLAIAGATALANGIFGSKPKTGSTYSSNAKSYIDESIDYLRGMRANGGMDITQNQGYQQGQDWLNSLFNDPEFFKNMEAPAIRQFNEEIIPGLANRFAGMGSGGSTGSTAFRNQLAREGSNLETNLAAMRAGLQQQGVNQQLGYAQQPVQNMLGFQQQALVPTKNTYQGPSGGPFAGIPGSIIGGYAQGYGQQWGQQQAGQYQPPPGGYNQQPPGGYYQPPPGY